MARKYRQDFSITGVINSTVWDSGITSSEAERKILKKVVLLVTDHNGNLVKGNHEREEIFSVYDYHIDTNASSGGANTRLSVNKIADFDIDLDLDLGKTFNIGVDSGGVATSVFGYYEYELAS